MHDNNVVLTGKHTAPSTVIGCMVHDCKMVLQNLFTNYSEKYVYEADYHRST